MFDIKSIEEISKTKVIINLYVEKTAVKKNLKELLLGAPILIGFLFLSFMPEVFEIYATFSEAALVTIILSTIITAVFIFLFVIISLLGIKGIKAKIAQITIEDIFFTVVFDNGGPKKTRSITLTQFNFIDTYGSEGRFNLRFHKDNKVVDSFQLFRTKEDCDKLKFYLRDYMQKLNPEN